MPCKLPLARPGQAGPRPPPSHGYRKPRVRRLARHRPSSRGYNGNRVRCSLCALIHPGTALPVLGLTSFRGRLAWATVYDHGTPLTEMLGSSQPTTWASCCQAKVETARPGADGIEAVLCCVLGSYEVTCTQQHPAAQRASMLHMQDRTGALSITYCVRIASLSPAGVPPIPTRHDSAADHCPGDGALFLLPCVQRHC